MTQNGAPEVPVWTAVMEHLAGDSRITGIQRGFLNLVVPQGELNGQFFLDVPSELASRQVGSLSPILIEAFAAVAPSSPVTAIRISVEEQLQSSTPAPVVSFPEPAAAPATISQTPQGIPLIDGSADSAGVSSRTTTRLNPKYTFENFVTGGNNRFAHAAAFAVAETPAKAYNPLFIYGDSGLGKTHLLHAIGDYAQNLYPGIRVRYVSTEEFTNDFINAIANNRAADFQARYRNVDILLIDDIQFLQGRAETQEAFFHTFNTLHDDDKQVVITSDVAPKLLSGFEDRMLSRFEWGLTTDVQAPDLETRIAILRTKAQSDRLLIPDDVIEYIAAAASANVRELEGALVRVTAYANLNRSTPDVALAKTVLRDIIDQTEDNVIMPVDIINTTAAYFSLSVDDLYGSSRSAAIATARQIAMYLCRERTDLSLPKIGQLFGNRDHTTVMYAYKKISELMKERRSIYNQVSEITAQLGRR